MPRYHQRCALLRGTRCSPGLTSVVEREHDITNKHHITNATTYSGAIDVTFLGADLVALTGAAMI